MAFDGLSDILKKAQARFPALSKRLVEAEALSRWETAVGPAIAKHSRAIRVQDSVLWVEVDHPIWRSELHHRKRQILDILNAVTPGPPVRQPTAQAKAKANAKGIPSGASALPPAKPETLVDILFVDPRR